MKESDEKYCPTCRKTIRESDVHFAAYMAALDSLETPERGEDMDERIAFAIAAAIYDLVQFQSRDGDPNE